MCDSFVVGDSGCAGLVAVVFGFDFCEEEVLVGCECECISVDGGAAQVGPEGHPGGDGGVRPRLQDSLTLDSSNEVNLLPQQNQTQVGL